MTYETRSEADTMNFAARMAEMLDAYRGAMDGVFGEDATTVLSIRPEGVVKID